MIAWHKEKKKKLNRKLGGRVLVTLGLITIEAHISGACGDNVLSVCNAESIKTTSGHCKMRWDVVGISFRILPSLLQKWSANRSGAALDVAPLCQRGEQFSCITEYSYTQNPPIHTHLRALQQQ